jgi:ATP-binding cassette, subfamily B, bacterial
MGEGDKGPMDELCRYADRPYAFIARYLRRRLWAHVAIVGFVLVAVACAVATQYGVKLLVDTLVPQAPVREVWLAF